MVIPNAGATTGDGEIVDEGPLPDPLHNFHAIPVDFFDTAHFTWRDTVSSVCRVFACFEKLRLVCRQCISR
jgi:hypothetical protein